MAGNIISRYQSYWMRLITFTVAWLDLVRMSTAFSICTGISSSLLKTNKNGKVIRISLSRSRGTSSMKAFTNTGGREGEEVPFSSTIRSDNHQEGNLPYEKKITNVIAYRSTHITLKNDSDDAINVPVSMWYPVHLDKKELKNDESNSKDIIKGQSQLYNSAIKYKYTISISKVAKLIARWNLPQFLKRDFELDPMLVGKDKKYQHDTPTTAVFDDDEGMYIVDGADHVDIPRNIPILLLAHGYLGSRWDLCHIAEEMSHYGFLCLSPEYPESLAASYELAPTTTIRLDRSTITSKLLQVIHEEWNLQPPTYGIVGHSLGCGTVMSTGDDTWVRICIAGPPATPSSFLPYSPSPISSTSPILCVASPNDGAVSWSRRIEPFLAQEDYTVVDDRRIDNNNYLPYRSVYVFSDSPSSPNHISFLAENVNDAMISFLSFLLPVAKALKLPVLDFDKYRESRDSKLTATKVVPLIRKFLLQHTAKR